jgi:hypothetical protein
MILIGDKIMSIWEFNDYDYEALQEAIEASQILSDRGIDQDEDMAEEIAVLAKWESMMELHTNLLEVEEDK